MWFWIYKHFPMHYLIWSAQIFFFFFEVGISEKNEEPKYQGIWWRLYNFRLTTPGSEFFPLHQGFLSFLCHELTLWETAEAFEPILRKMLVIVLRKYHRITKETNYIKIQLSKYLKCLIRYIYTSLLMQ